MSANPLATVFAALFAIALIALVALLVRKRRIGKSMQTFRDELIAASAADMVGLPRSVSSTDDNLGVARSDYYDALVALEATPAAEPELYSDAKRQLVLAKQRYNAARSSVGIDPIE